MNHVRTKGFTIIELMLAMTFVSALLLAITLSVIQIGRSYNRGLTMKEVNDAGRLIVDDLKTSINQSSSFDITGDKSYYIDQDWGGRLCLGRYSYIWNYGQALVGNNESQLNIYNNSEQDIRFIKVVDIGASYCADASTGIDVSKSSELLSAGQHNLSIHDFKIQTNDLVEDSASNQKLYNIQFVIGTNDQAALSYNNGDSVVECKLANSIDADQEYCMINRFNITVRAGNVTN